MAPIRVGIIGLRAGYVDKGIMGNLGHWAFIGHLRSIQAMPGDYEIVAVCNSTVESAQKAIDGYGLPAKAYGGPDDIAKDPRVELVVVAVNVEKHFELAKPAIENKKDVFVEWPLGATLKQSEELTRMAASAGVKTMVGVQARADPMVVKLKEILASGKIGRVVSTSVVINSSFAPMDAWVEGAEYYLGIESGGNEYSIGFGHFLDTFVHVLGDFADLQAMLKTNVTSLPVMNAKGEVVNPSHAKTSPDHAFVQGTLESGAMASIAVRKSQAAVDGVGFRWFITGTEGEVGIVTGETMWQFADPKRTLRLKVGKNEVEEIEFLAKEDELEAKVPFPGTNSARQYQGFAKGDTETCATFESALKTHRLLDGILVSAGWKSV
ncbi:Uu.00g022540.m01.CDS01 [Anthostomella pinea]|uniref:Uu.00g022540.m01.CDS01 n=1 Tax=Anthostomella pinea TaxID=933095 RepID=A0AAI8YR01_9PEZI|nr:Uu.00g022540.m01.CDS01 [Anthostomella pinea]